MIIPAENVVKIRCLGPKTKLMSAHKKCIYLYKSGFCIFNYYRGVLLNPASFAPGKILVRSMHSPHVLLALCWGKSKHPHMVDPPTWVGVTHGGHRMVVAAVGSGRLTRWGKNVNMLCEVVARPWDFRCVAHF